MFYLRKASEKMISTRLNMAERAKDTSFTAKSLFEGQEAVLAKLEAMK